MESDKKVDPGKSFYDEEKKVVEINKQIIIYEITFVLIVLIICHFFEVNMGTSRCFRDIERSYCLEKFIMKKIIHYVLLYLVNRLNHYAGDYFRKSTKEEEYISKKKPKEKRNMHSIESGVKHKKFRDNTYIIYYFVCNKS